MEVRGLAVGAGRAWADLKDTRLPEAVGPGYFKEPSRRGALGAARG